MPVIYGNYRMHLAEQNQGVKFIGNKYKRILSGGNDNLCCSIISL